MELVQGSRYHDVGHPARDTHPNVCRHRYQPALTAAIACSLVQPEMQLATAPLLDETGIRAAFVGEAFRIVACKVRSHYHRIGSQRVYGNGSNCRINDDTIESSGSVSDARCAKWLVPGKSARWQEAAGVEKQQNGKQATVSHMAHTHCAGQKFEQR